jgi:hypothetical protein
MSEQSRLKGAVTRAQRRVDAIDMEYGAASIPLDHPLYAKREVARQKHKSALQALIAHQDPGVHAAKQERMNAIGLSVPKPSGFRASRGSGG